MAKKLAAETNGFDPAILSQFVKDIERLEEEMASKQGEYMAYCRGKREQINGYLDRAKDAGVPKKELKAALKIRKLTRKIEGVRDDLEEDQRETLDMIREALGDFADTPLGRAAMPDEEWDEAEPEPDQTAENVTRLQAGMKPLAS